MHPFSNLFKVNWLAIVAATVAGFFIGFLWYALLFDAMWMDLTGITPEMIEGSSVAMTMGISILVTFIAAWGLAVLIGKVPSASNGMMTGTFVSLFFVATMLAQNYVYSLNPLGLWLIDAGFIVVMFAVMGAMIGMMKKPISGF